MGRLRGEEWFLAGAHERASVAPWCPEAICKMARVCVWGGVFVSQGSKPITFFGCSEGPEELRGGEQRTDVDLSHPWKSCCPRPLPAAPLPKSTVSSEVGWTEPHKGELVYIAHCYLGLCRVVECP